MTTPDHDSASIAYARAFLADDTEGMAVIEHSTDLGDLLADVLGLAVALGVLHYGSEQALDKHLANWLRQ